MTARWVDDLFPVDAPCPWCGHRRVFGFLLRDAAGKHQHTRYGCAAWPLCTWIGWTVPAGSARYQRPTP